MDVETYMMRGRLERDEKWRDCIDAMPYLRFPESWEVAVIPPFAGAMARFWVRRGKAHVSVYADFHNVLGCVGEPYWEIHPSADLEDCDRFLLNETDDLIAGIEASLAAQERRAAEQGNAR